MSQPQSEPNTYRQHRYTPPPDATEILLVRHGESQPVDLEHPFELVDGHGDPPLDPAGVDQAERLAQRLAGEDIAGLPPHHISQKAIARSYQTTNILPGATVLENVRIAAQSRRHSWSLLRHYRAFTDVLDRAHAVLESVGLGDKDRELAANLSHGEQRNLEIGIALATDPKLLCLDEPTAGMSVAETHQTVELIRRIAENLTIMIVEHDMEVVMGLAHTLTVLHYGEVLAEGTPEQIQANPRVQEVYLKT